MNGVSCAKGMSQYWMAPEVIRSVPDNSKINLLCLGITILETLTQEPLYDGFSACTQIHEHIRKSGDPIAVLDKEPELQLNLFTSQCSQVDTQKQRTAKVLQSHEFVAFQSSIILVS